ncbi:tape measure protein [Corynebacterium wankanglinii]|uniref:Tape measure protein n=1 Tax=Corynebacterium wankanglinii TaxID=2735136 RepID=A0A838CGF5_9CORY|nr:tape measure protein [Corynebacterium wankanglinii]MBA1834168.1 tape measure protein [Corynebacterium wankanglinii]
MAVQLGTAYVLIKPSTKNMQKDITSAMRGMGFSNMGEQAGEQLGQGMGVGTEKGFGGHSVGSKITSMVGKTMKAGVLGVGAAAGGAMATAFAKGFGRLNSLEQAEAKLRGLGNSAQDVSAIMDNALAAVKGTSFGMGEAATVAAQMVASGIKPGQQLESVLRTVGDTASIAGASMDEMGLIFGSVAARGKLQGDDMMQLLGRGIPVMQLLAEETGKTTEEISEMVSRGEIDFETFANAMNKGMGGAALEAGNTFKGALANMGSAMGRFGATLLEPVFKNMPAIFGAVGDAFDDLGTKLEPVVTSVADWLAPKMENFATVTVPKVVDGIMSMVDGLIKAGEWIQKNATWIVPLTGAIGTLAAAYGVLATQQKIAAAGGLVKWFTSLTKVTQIQAAAQTILNTVMAANPIGLVITAVAALVTGLTLFFTKTETGRELWSKFMDGLRSAGEWLQGTFAPIFERIGDAVSSAVSVVSEKVGAIVDTVKGVVDILFKGDYTGGSLFGLDDESSGTVDFLFRVRDTVIALKDAAVAAFDWMGAKWQEFAIGFGQFYDTWVSPVVTFFTEAFNVVKEVVGSAFSVISENARIFGEMLGLVFSGVRDAFSVVGSVITSVATVVIQPAWNMIQMGAQIMWTVLQGVFQMIQTAFQFVGTMIQSVWTNIIAPTWGFLKEAAGLLADVLTGNFENIGNRFSSMGDFISQIVQGPINVAMDLFRGLVDMVGAAWRTFQSTVSNVVGVVKTKIGEMVNNIREIPGKIKSIFADAGQWLLSAGRNIISGLWSGMQQMWDNMTSWLTSLPGRIRNAIGSISFGFGDGSSNANGSFTQYVAGGIDRLEAYANGGGKLPTQAVIKRPAGTRGLVQWAERETGGEAFIPLAASKRTRSTAILNAVAETFGWQLRNAKTGLPYGNTYSGDLGPQVVGTFADGGVTGDDLEKFLRGGSVNGYRASLPLEGAPYIWGGQHPRWGDCSGTVSTVAALARGLNPAPRRFATGSQASWLSANGFLRGRGGDGDLRIGFKNGGPAGGHTSGTLPNGVNFEMGGGRGNGQYGGRAAGAWDSYYNEFFYLPMKEEKWEDPKVGGLKNLTTAEKDVVETAAATVDTTQAATKQPATPYEAFATTFAKEMGNRSVAEIGFDAVTDFFGVNPKLTRKVLFTPMDELLGVADVDKQTAPGGNPRTSVAKAHAETLHDDAVTTLTPAEMAKSNQLKGVQDADVVEQKDVPQWGPQFFAHEIARKARAMGLDKLAAQIGIATALVESGNPLKMYANRKVPDSLNYRHDALGSDYDSVGLFQQRDNGAWGTVKQRMTPFDSAGMFFAKLQSFDYKAMDPGAAAQKVQVSAFPDRYGKQMAAAKSLLAQTGVFDKGGLARGLGFMRKATIEPERVLSPKMTPLFDRFIGLLPRFMETVDTARAEMRVSYAGGDAGYGALAELFGDEVGRRLADSAFWTGGLQSELEEAFRGGDFGYASAAHLFGERAGRALVDEAGWLGTAFEEVTAAARGEDFGLAATARYLGGSEAIASKFLDAVTSVGAFTGTVVTAREELDAAFVGEDFGTGAVEELLGEQRGRAVATEIGWLGTAFEEVTAAARGEDFGLAATARYLGGNETVAAQVLDGIETAGTAKETVVNLWADPADLLTAETISQMVNNGMEGLRMEIKGRKPAPMMMTRGGAM